MNTYTFRNTNMVHIDEIEYSDPKTKKLNQEPYTGCFKMGTKSYEVADEYIIDTEPRKYSVSIIIGRDFLIKHKCMICYDIEL